MWQFLPSSVRQVAAETVSQLGAALGVTLAEFFAPFRRRSRLCAPEPRRNQITSGRFDDALHRHRK